MRIETILDAMVMTQNEIVGYENCGWNIDWWKRSRQYKAFRDRIIRMDKEKDAEIAELKNICEIYGLSILEFLEPTNDN